jgi:hypothetical protein
MPCSKRPVQLPNGDVAELRDDLTAQCVRQVLAELHTDVIAAGCTFRGRYPSHGGDLQTLNGRVLCGAHVAEVMRCRGARLLARRGFPMSG